MNSGGFSISLAVKDLKKSKEFYESIGFSVFHGDEAQGFLIMKSPSVNIGLFQGMFVENIMTFNPGWDENAQPVEPFTDVRELKKTIESKGIVTEGEVDESASGPASFSITDPDGNQILFDQHV